MFLDIGVTLRNGNGFWRGVLRGIHRKAESRVFHKHLFSPLEMGAESEERLSQKVCFRAIKEI